MATGPGLPTLLGESQTSGAGNALWAMEKVALTAKLVALKALAGQAAPPMSARRALVLLPGVPSRTSLPVRDRLSATARTKSWPRSWAAPSDWTDVLVVAAWGLAGMLLLDPLFPLGTANGLTPSDKRTSPPPLLLVVAALLAGIAAWQAPPAGAVEPDRSAHPCRAQQRLWGCPGQGWVVGSGVWPRPTGSLPYNAWQTASSDQ